MAVGAGGVGTLQHVPAQTSGPLAQGDGLSSPLTAKGTWLVLSDRVLLPPTPAVCPRWDCAFPPGGSAAACDGFCFVSSYRNRAEGPRKSSNNHFYILYIMILQTLLLSTHRSRCGYCGVRATTGAV